MPSLQSLDDLLQEELKDIYDAEKQLTKALPKMSKKATSPELKDAFDEHLRQTEEHIERLEQIFELLDMPAKGKKCQGMKNLIAEGDEMISEADDDASRDALLVAAAQKVEHYEMASYGTMRTWANILGKNDAASLFEETLDEEKETDQRLTQIAESFVNEAAARGSEDEDEDMPSRGRRARQARTGRATRSVAADRARGRSRR
jgi:ferritin-like metal-binding protein YciE